MSVYIIARFKIHDRGEYDKYSAGFSEVFKKFDGMMSLPSIILCPALIWSLRCFRHYDVSLWLDSHRMSSKPTQILSMGTQ